MILTAWPDQANEMVRPQKRRGTRRSRSTRANSCDYLLRLFPNGRVDYGPTLIECGTPPAPVCGAARTAGHLSVLSLYPG